jgi:tRNA (guanine-N7-)-methyltransferase
MAKHKLQHFAENLTFPNMFQLRFEELRQGFQYKGKWNEFFGNDHPIVLELGCGKGEYTVNLAERYPGKNFVGIDVKGARMWKGCKTSNERQMKNVAFIRTHVQVIRDYFEKAEVSEIWITFPDPQPQSARAKKRLTASRFLAIYRDVLIPGGIVHLKTDNAGLYDFTMEVVKDENHQLIFGTHDLYNSPGPDDAKAIQTFYESKYLAENKPICYMEFTLTGNSKL